MAERSFELAGEGMTVRLGETLGPILSELAIKRQSAVTVFLQGDLGAGKTTLTRGILRSLGYTGAVKSPTYTLVEPYSCGGVEIFHFDLYRLRDPEELEYMGIRDYFSRVAVCVVEWPDHAGGLLPEPDVTVDIAYAGGSRTAVVKSSLISDEQMGAMEGAIKA